MPPRWMTLLMVGLMGAAFTAVAAPARAGGFCSEGNFTDAATTEIRLSKMCFSPTVARVEPGDTVTFKNDDATMHMVGGVANVFGNLHTELEPRGKLSYRFDEEGTYPYLCILHPGMGGAIVVGDGKGKAATASASEVNTPPVATEKKPVPTEAGDKAWLVPLAVLLALGVLAIGAIPSKRRISGMAPTKS